MLLKSQNLFGGGINGVDVPSSPTQLALPAQFTHGARANCVVNPQVVGNNGQIVGVAFDQLGGQSAALFWSSTSATATPLPAPAGTKSSSASSLNDNGQIVGNLVAADGSTHAVLWPSAQSQPTDLGELCGFTSATAVAINAAGDIVGATNTNSLYNNPRRALFWDSKDGLLDLNNLIPANSGWTLQTVAGIGNSRLIIGAGLLNGQLHGYLLVPTN